MTTLAGSGELTVAGVTKRYGNVTALKPLQVTFLPGEVHAVMGENGAGKSTLMHVLAGFTRPDAGEISLGGTPIALGDPVAARRAGVAMVHQHFTLVSAFSVLENLALVELQNLRGLVALKEVRQRAEQLTQTLNWSIPFDAPAGELPVGVRQRIEILKVLLDDAQVLIFDEPTAVLTPDEVDEFFEVVRSLRAAGRTILIIGHKIAEVQRIADRVTVLRRGEWIATSPMAGLSPDQIAEWMIGESPEPSSTSTAQATKSVARVQLRDLRVRSDDGRLMIRGLNLGIDSGEVLGIGGVDGNGQVEFAEALAGVRGYTGQLVRPVRTGYIPQDRQVDGLAMDLSLLDNFLIEGYARDDLRTAGFMSLPRSRKWAEELVAQYGIKIGTLNDPARSLSGGNQQKLIVSRVLSSNPEFIVCVNPTRGLDFKSTQFVLDALQGAASRGTAVALISTDRDELAAIAHRTLYLHEGQLFSSPKALGGSPA